MGLPHQGAFVGTVALLALLVTSRDVPSERVPEVLYDHSQPSGQPVDELLGYQAITDGYGVKLCECELASGEPGGLSCTKQGWFISNFEHEGTWMGGGGTVPLSHAICCRPCLPETLPPALTEYIKQRDSQVSATVREPDTSQARQQQPAHTLDSLSSNSRGSSDSQKESGADERQPQHKEWRKLQEDALARSAGRASGHQPAAAGTAAATAAGSPLSAVSEPDKQGLVLPTAADNHPSKDSTTAAVTADPAPVAPLAIVSVGCHASSGHSYSALTCEAPGASFVTGFSQAEQVSAFYSDIFYPLGQVECCTPAALLPSGEVWPLLRCNCRQTWTKDCGGLETHQLLWGFSAWRATRAGDLLPVAPLECCQLCLADAPTAAVSCQDLNLCSGTGICVLGSCQCFEGWGGADCSVAQSSGEDGSMFGLPWWGACLALGGLLLLTYGSLSAGRATYDAMLASLLERRLRHQRGGGGGGDLSGPTGRLLAHGQLGDLLQTLLADETGSVGSVDTDEGDNGEGEEGGGGGRQGAAREAASAGSGDATEGEVEGGGGGECAHEGSGVSGTDGDVGHAGDHGGKERDVGDVRGASASSTPRGDSESTADDIAGPSGRHEDGAGGGEDELGDEAQCAEVARRAGAAEQSRIAGPVCVVCLEAPIQVALVPCGHANVCRKCARRLTTCPVCRKMITRRQRLYFGAG